MSAATDRRYVERHFWTVGELAEAVGATVERVNELIAAGCAPGPVYILGPTKWWSALDPGDQVPPSGEAWYSPGAAWGLRRAELAMRGGVGAADAAALLERSFCDAFVQALGKVEGARSAFPGCFDKRSVDDASARLVALGEWASWLDGGYAVCLRVFTGWTCVAKETLGAAVKAALDAGGYDPDELLVQVETLAGLVLPFAPWQRPGGTPGRTIDRLLGECRLGRERPYDRL